MRIISAIIVFMLLSGSNIAQAQIKNRTPRDITSKSAKFICSFKDKKGNLLGNLYIDDYKSDVFKKLLILKRQKGKLDTLYFINNWVFRNPKGIDITFAKEDFNGYKIEYVKESSIQLFGVGSESRGSSDPATIIWNPKKKLFEVYQDPN